jgi:hypothetical protein
MLENTSDTDGPWVIAVRDSTSCLQVADDQSALMRIISCDVLHERKVLFGRL